ncbi:MAG: CinA family protein [Magnetococcales bacterium]|nr:CinA family protein [Magnetococcales bacterium]
MKSLLVIQRWNDTESLTPATGRPYLDLLLNTLGFAHIDVLELTPGERFDLDKVDSEVRLILVQGQTSGSITDNGRLRRSLLSGLGLSLGLDSEGSDRLRVVGAKPLYNSEEVESGFAIKRHGRIVAYFENSVWDLNKSFSEVMLSILTEERSSRRIRFHECWLVEGVGHTVDMTQFMEEEELAQCYLKYLPAGDVAILMPKFMGDEFKNRLKSRLQNHLYTTYPQSLEEGLGNLLRENNATVATAESCTAGLISDRLASTPGSSDYLLSAYVTYSRQAKITSLGVAEVLIDKYGEVSREIAIAMARGALKAAGTTLAVSATGIAGPGGGSDEKPVGLVYLAVVSSDGSVLEHKGFYKGNRDRIRLQASQTALHMLRRIITK